MKRFLNLPSIIAIVWSVFQLYTASFGSLTNLTSRAIHVGFALALTFSLIKIAKNNGILSKIINLVLVVLSLTAGFYIAFADERLSSRIPYVDGITQWDIIFGLIIIVLLLEAARRTIGYMMTLLALGAIVYGAWGAGLPGLLAHRGMNLEDMVNLQFLSVDGIFGVPIGVSVDYVFYFMLFGAFLDISGGGKLFIDIAYNLTRKLKGGPAKAAVIGSSLMGSLSGSSAANVASVGIFTIPLMKRTGYSPMFAASVEALSSTGGQILPPIMGATAFIMADMLGMKYSAICLAALIPALLYYLSIYFMVDLKARKDNLGTLDDEELVVKKDEILKRLHMLIPLVILVVMIFYGYTLQKAAFWSTVAVVIVSLIRKGTRFGFVQFVDALESGAKQAIQIAIPCALMGVIVGIIGYTGLGLKFTSLIVQYSMGSFVLSILLVSLACLILGLGMPTTSAYITSAVLLAPALQEFGVDRLTAHMFVFYLACLSMISPPVALASDVAAGIAGTKSFQTGMVTSYYAIPLVLIPFAFLVSPQLLMLGSWSEIVMVTAFTSLGIFALCVAVAGYWFSNTGLLVRIGFYLTSICLIIPNITFGIVGAAGFLLLGLYQKLKKSRNPQLEKDITMIGV
jgi:TRAP transporter 4TM/12TM fusion protein